MSWSKSTIIGIGSRIRSTTSGSSGILSLILIVGFVAGLIYVLRHLRGTISFVVNFVRNTIQFCIAHYIIIGIVGLIIVALSIAIGLIKKP